MLIISKGAVNSGHEHGKNMKLLSYTRNGREGFGAVKNDMVVDLGSRMPGIQSLRDLLIVDKVEKAREIVSGADADYAFDDITFEPVIPDTEKLICIGVNYGNRNAEYKDGSEAPKYPSVFMRTYQSVTGHLQPLMRPPESEQLDYEGEIVIVIGKQGRRIPEASALEHIAGLSLCNEGSIRDYLRHAKFNVTQGKNFEKSGSIGPWMVTADEFDGYDNLHITTHVNGEKRQDDNTNNMIFPFQYLISYLSTFFHLQPGDVIVTGTPIGAGARFDPPIWLVPGDEVVVEVPGIGRLVNGIADEEVE